MAATCCLCADSDGDRVGRLAQPSSAKATAAKRCVDQNLSRFSGASGQRIARRRCYILAPLLCAATEAAWAFSECFTPSAQCFCSPATSDLSQQDAAARCDLALISWCSAAVVFASWDTGFISSNRERPRYRTTPGPRFRSQMGAARNPSQLSFERLDQGLELHLQ